MAGDGTHLDELAVRVQGARVDPAEGEGDAALVGGQLVREARPGEGVGAARLGCGDELGAGGAPAVLGLERRDLGGEGYGLGFRARVRARLRRRVLNC